MGSQQIILDHSLAYDLWRDPLFRELTPWFDDHRDEAELVLHKAETQQSCLAIKNSKVYTEWLDLLHRLVETDVEQLRPLFQHIHNKRNNRNESVVIPAKTAGQPGIIYGGLS